jgi:hypothetical protein
MFPLLIYWIEFTKVEIELKGFLSAPSVAKFKILSQIVIYFTKLSIQQNYIKDMSACVYFFSTLRSRRLVSIHIM